MNKRLFDTPHLERLVKFISMTIVMNLAFPLLLPAQSLFEEAEDSSKEQRLTFEWNGYLRSDLFVGKVPDKNEGELKSGYGEASLKLKVRRGNLGDAFAEIRFRSGREFNKSVSEVNLREAYINAYIGAFDFRIGHQIVVWGRADGINPTDNITPKNMLARSPDEDDRREANFLVRSYYNMYPIRIEAIWVPSYEPSYIPFDIISYPPGITLGEPDFPDSSLKNSGVALRLNLELPSIDGSISYFNGYNPMPGIAAGTPQFLPAEINMNIFPRSYRMHVLGADFQTIIAGSFGLRGEIAYSDPHEDHEANVHVPNPDLEYIVGIDREFSGDFSLIFQYIGRYVLDFKELERPLYPVQIPEYELRLRNRLITSQQNELSHSVSLRAEQRFLYETLKLELLGMVNFTTEEFFLRPKVTYDVTDALTFILGGELFSGPDDTLFGTVDSTLNSVFVELKASF